MKPPQKLQQYEALYGLNRGLEQVITDLTRLMGLGFRRQIVRHFQIVIEESRAWANFELTLTLLGREERDWARYRRIRRQWEKRLRDPVLIEAERLGQKRQEFSRSEAPSGAFVGPTLPPVGKID